MEIQINTYSPGDLMNRFLTLIAALLTLSNPQISQADIEIPMGGMGGCPFLHEDRYDITPLMETLKTQLATVIENRKSCSQDVQAIYANLLPLQDFYKNLDPATRQKITKNVYGNALNALYTRKVELEVSNETASMEYDNVVSQISNLETSLSFNEIDLQTLQMDHRQNLEADYRNQLLQYSSNVLNAYSTTAKNRPECIGQMAGWSDILTVVLNGISVGANLGLNPTAQVISAASGISAQLVTAFQDVGIRRAYNNLVRVKNYKTLACTYFSIRKAACEYQRAHRVSRDPQKIRNFIRNRFSPLRRGEYERFYVNQGRVTNVGQIFRIIAQMGSPLTLNQEILNAYLAAKAVDLTSLGTPPEETDNDEMIKTWLFRAKSFGLEFQQYQPMSSTPLPLREQLASAKADIVNKLATIQSAESLIRENLSFLDLRRRLSSDFPNIKRDTQEMKEYLSLMIRNPLVKGPDKGAVHAAIVLLEKLNLFIELPFDAENLKDYEDEIVVRGGKIFEELAKGSVAQLNRQSVLALAAKGIDRLNWSFGVIANAYASRDQDEGLPESERFTEFTKNYNVLSDVISNYNAFYGPGTTFRNEELSRAMTTFEKTFKKDILRSLELAMDESIGWADLRGNTAAHLCALYAPSLRSLSGRNLLGNNSATKLLDLCERTYKILEMNRLVSDQDFVINYSDACTYLEYNRETDIQDLLARLIQP